MSRTQRPYCPGVAFHITTRLHAKAKLFDPPTRLQILGMLAECLRMTDTQVIAHAIMTSHLHLIVRQHRDPLSRLMQPWKCRIALMMRRKTGLMGHIFERPYFALPCVTARHLREAIVYTHLNPVRAGLCATADDADCTSHRVYASARGSADAFDKIVTNALQLFAASRETPESEWHQDYLRYLDYRIQCDRADEANQLRPPYVPEVSGGDEFFDSRFTTPTPALTPRLPHCDLRDIAVAAVSHRFGDMPLSQLRGSRLPAATLTSLRNDIIRQAALHGHSGAAIATFFAMSRSRVSEICRQVTSKHG